MEWNWRHPARICCRTAWYVGFSPTSQPVVRCAVLRESVKRVGKALGFFPFNTSTFPSVYDDFLSAKRACVSVFVCNVRGAKILLEF